MKKRKKFKLINGVANVNGKSENDEVSILEKKKEIEKSEEVLIRTDIHLTATVIMFLTLIAFSIVNTVSGKVGIHPLIYLYFFVDLILISLNFIIRSKKVLHTHIIWSVGGVFLVINNFVNQWII
ncbi:hypothetical protein AM501_05270 [Aneurinibacillus migulanus]|nr:hypothetical protein TS64_04345 [Aneurinibacillus migulanus]KPD09247.1 hypothetical protein AM501_05270 [Aneurinibacillus migulanus]